MDFFCASVVTFFQPTIISNEKRGKLKVEIWSDVMCPFCFIGKRRFESALSQFDHRDDVEIIWKSFQLDPHLESNANKSVNQYLAERKGWTLDYSKQMNEHITRMAAEVGLTYDFDKAVVANSFDAHRVLQFAKTKNRGDAMEEQLFNAYFANGKNIADKNDLVELGVSAGLDKREVTDVLNGDAYTQDVYNDLVEAEKIGVSGVPFFVLDGKYGVSGAQQPELFLQALQRAHGEWKESKSKLTVVSNGDACAVDGDC